MTDNLQSAVRDICQTHGRDRGRLIDILRAVQTRFGCVSGAAMDVIAHVTGVHRVEVESTVSFYSFLSTTPKGKVIQYTMGWCAAPSSFACASIKVAVKDSRDNKGRCSAIHKNP